jgi:undecaprenyl-diphosphatase
MSHLTYPEAMVVGLIQGVTELFPVSSLGHNVLIPALIGGSWAHDLNVSRPESPYLAFIVGMHVATAIAMIIFFWRDWLRIVGGFFTSFRQFARPAPRTVRFQTQTLYQRLAWMIVVATIPVGIAGLALEHAFRVIFSKPIPTAIFLAVNGLILFAGERLRRRGAADGHGERFGYIDDPGPALTGGRGAAGRGSGALGSAGTGVPAGPGGPAVAYGEPGGSGRMAAGPGAGRPWPHHAPAERPVPGVVDPEDPEDAIQADKRLAKRGYLEAFILGTVQILALLPGISRDGVVMVGGMFRGLSRADAARFSFLLSAPVILAAGVLKIPDLLGPLGNGIRGQVLAGSILSGVGAYVALRLFMRWIQNSSRTLAPFATYCLVVGVGSAIYLSIR